MTKNTNPARVLVTADHHFGHAGILRMDRVHFTDIDTHDEMLVTAWNAAVRPGDEVWHLGDFCYRCTPERAARIFARLHGTKRLVVGNHDKGSRHLGWASQHEGYVDTVIEGQRVTLCHFPMRAWQGVFRGAWHLFGHTHGLLEDSSQSCDVGVDRWGYRPASMSEIRARLAATDTLPEERRRAQERDEAGGEA
ncbi:metallophosphoesterase family protein [Methylorubrum extorquens]|uniref:metallophosphoesterase family protein n=1 Tax=Methylorubrum extorquens TaxID=408 RepID=UPI001EE581DA|nr:metallophosphoesterase family protein [Methylorubrum extorquens]MCG5244840.1 metallophosphoesterase family protein [Methylorubrum extorquens]